MKTGLWTATFSHLLGGDEWSGDRADHLIAHAVIEALAQGSRASSGGGAYDEVVISDLLDGAAELT